jgi:predicted ATP-grasp superfamily ATP-dependent carboligase
VRADRRPDRPPAILLGGLETAVPVARSLGRAGIAVHAAGGPRDPVRYSRYTASYFAADGPDAPARWLGWLRDAAPRGVVIAVADTALELVARHHDELRALGFVPAEQRPDVVFAMLDKTATYAVADRAGVPRPATWPLGAGAPAPSGLVFPCAVKPVQGHRFSTATGIRDKVLVLRDPVELDALLGRAGDAPVFATELVPGPDHLLQAYFTYLTPEGEPLFGFTQRKLRQEVPHFGVGCFVVAEHDPEIAELGLRLVREAGLVGPAMVEFKRDARTGEPKLIECNHRINLQVQLLISSGIDLPLLIYRRALGEAVAPIPAPRYGARLWNPLPDYRSMRTLRAEGELTVPAWLRSLVPPLRFTVWDPRDPRPTLVDTGRHARRLAGRALPRGRS